MPAHVHARAVGQFWQYKSIKCLDLYLRHKCQANSMKNNEVIAHWILHKYNTFARANVHARASLLFWPCRSVGDLNIYLPYKFEQRIKRLVLHVFLCKISNARAHACVHFQKKLLSFGTFTNAKLSTWKVSYWSLLQFLRTFWDKKVPEKKKNN
jgi:hypothetical protein